MPVIVGAPGLVREGMDQNLGKFPRASNINELQKIILLGTVHILKRFLFFKTKLVSSTLRTVAVKLVYSPTRFV